MNGSEVRRVLDNLMSAWPHTDLPEETIGRWRQMLSHFPFDVAMVAAESCIKVDKFFPSIARYREAFASCGRDERHEWTGSPTCPVCRGTTVVTDGDGRDWLCRCAVYERRPKVHNATTAPPPELLAAARRVLKEAP